METVYVLVSVKHLILQEERKYFRDCFLQSLNLLIMYYKLNNYVFVRKINNHLKIWDKLNDRNCIGDISAYLFLKHLNYEPKYINDIVLEISKEFVGNVDFEQIKKDAINLFEQLNKSEFIAIGNSPHECIKNSIKYSNSSYQRTKTEICDISKEKLDIFGKKYTENPMLQGVIIEITQICNERCVHCYIPHETKTTKMEDEDFFNLIDELKKLESVVDVKISGGECMTHPSFKNFISYVKKSGFHLTIMTNLTLLDNEIVQILKEGSMSKVQVSLFSLKSEIHDAITKRPGSLNTVLNNINILQKENIQVCIATQIMEINKDEIEDIYLFCKNNNFDINLDWTITAQQDGNTQNLVQRVNDISYYKKICLIRSKYENNFTSNYLESLKLPLKDKNSSLCSAGMNMLHISSNLDIHPCPGWMLKVGNLKNETIENIWNNSEKLKYVRNLTLQNFTKCSECNNRNTCTICLAQAFCENNDKFEVPEYICKMFKTINKSLFSMSLKSNSDSN